MKLFRKFLPLCGFFATISMAGNFELREVPVLNEYCVAAQRIVTRTDQAVDVNIQASFDAFVMSKAVITDGAATVPEIQQFHWLDEAGQVTGVSCKLKSADHLNLVYGEATAGPDGSCQSMNQAAYQLIAADMTTPRFSRVVFDIDEDVTNQENPGMTGPDWLSPYRAMYLDASGELHVQAKGFSVDFTDPQFAQAPARFRGVHYCHFIAPDHLRSVLLGDAPPELSLGKLVDVSGYSAPGEEAPED